MGVIFIVVDECHAPVEDVIREELNDCDERVLTYLLVPYLFPPKVCIQDIEGA
jgi:hypothetical protein